MGHSDLGRCNLTFLNPGIVTPPKGTTHTISAGMQIVRAHEICGSHRHSMSALRFVVEGHPDAYTAVDGEALHMEQFDLLLTPRFSWHDHHNPSDQDIVWLDVLDIGLTLALNTTFYETYGATSQTLRPGATTSQQLRSHWLRPTWERARQGRLPIRYRWSDVVSVLDSYGDISGHGSIEVEGELLQFGPGDTYTVPNFAWQTLRNGSAEVVRIFSVHDTPAIQALGFFYEEPEPTLHAHPAPRIPTEPLNPVYIPGVLLDQDEVG